MSHTILVAFEVNADSFEDAQNYLIGRVLPCDKNVNGFTLNHLRRLDPERNIEAWWIAEDERYDGSTGLDSAVFVPRHGLVLKQEEAAEVLDIMTDGVLARMAPAYVPKHRAEVAAQ